MVAVSELVSQLAQRIRSAGIHAGVTAPLLVGAVCIVAVVLAVLLMPTPEPIVAAPLRWS